MNQTVFWSFAIVALFVWLVFRPFATAPWKILGLIALLVVVQALTAVALKASSHAYSLKYAYVLQALDQALGLTAFQIARLFTEGTAAALVAVYELLSAAMIAWFGIHLVIRGGEPRNPFYSYLIAFVASTRQLPQHRQSR